MVPALLTMLKEQPDNYWAKFMLEQTDPDAAGKVLTNNEQISGFSLNPANDPPESDGSCFGPGNSPRLLAAGDWSEPVKPSRPYEVLRGRLLVYEPSHYTNRFGEWWGDMPVEMELQDVTPSMGIAPMSVCFDYNAGLEGELRDAQGNRAPGGPTVSGSIPAPTWITVPFDGTVRFRVDRFNVASRTESSGTTIRLNTNNWCIPADNTNVWFLAATFKSEANRPNPIDYEVWTGTIQLPPVKIPRPKF